MISKKQCAAMAVAAFALVAQRGAEAYLPDEVDMSNLTKGGYTVPITSSRPDGSPHPTDAPDNPNNDVVFRREDMVDNDDVANLKNRRDRSGPI